MTTKPLSSEDLEEALSNAHAKADDLPDECHIQLFGKWYKLVDGEYVPFEPEEENP